MDERSRHRSLNHGDGFLPRKDLKLLHSALVFKFMHGAKSWRAVSNGIHLAPFEQDEIGPDPFRHACPMGLEGLVSKQDSRYRAGRSDRWVKENRQHVAFRPRDGAVVLIGD
jgi:hypothetical protein